ncbi:MAG: hypothetical protein AAF914_03930 [Pseudomonadota bacterium]
MRRKVHRRTALALVGMGLAGAGAPLPAQETERRRPEGGIGGTGIVGTLTDFGSLIVNGMAIETPSPTVTDAFGARSLDSLAIGHSLTIEARRTETAGLVAERVHLTQPVIGTVGFATPDGRSGVVDGVPVVLEPGAEGLLRPRARVAISGLWRGREVVASRVDAVPDGLDVLAGVVETRAAGTMVVSGRQVVLDGLDAPAPGAFVTVIGRTTGLVLEARGLREGRFFGSAGPLVSLSVEGYLQPRAGAPFFAVSGLGHSFDAAAMLNPFVGMRTLFDGGYDGTFRVETGILLPDNLTERRAIGAQLLAGAEVPIRPAR